MLHLRMNWTPVTSIRTRAAHPSTIRVPATSGVCGSRPGREHRESTGLSRSYRVGSYLVREDSSPGSVRLTSRRKIPLSPFSSNFAHRFRKHRKDRGDATVHSRKRKWAYSAQFWCNISPFRINTCKSVSKQITSTPFRMNTYEKNPGWWGHSSHPGTTSNQANPRLLCEPPYAQRLRVILFCLRLATVNFQLWTVDFLFPCATLSAPLRGGEPDADTRGCLETAVRVHGFREFAQTHAGSGSVCARLCAQDRGGRRDLGAGSTAARFRLRALAQSGAFAGSGASFGRRKDSARAGLLRGDRARDSFARGLLQFPAPDSAGAHALRLRRDRRLPDRLCVRAAVKKYFGSGSGFGKAPHEGQTLRQGRLARGRAQRRRRTWHALGRTHRLLHRGTAGTRRRAGPARLAVSLQRRLAEEIGRAHV